MDKYDDVVIADLEAQVARLEEKLEHLEGKASDNDCPYLADKVRAEEKLAALKKWVAHAPACGYGPSRYRQPDGCDCGLTEYLDRILQGGE